MHLHISLNADNKADTLRISASMTPPPPTPPPQKNKNKKINLHLSMALCPRPYSGFHERILTVFIAARTQRS